MNSEQHVSSRVLILPAWDKTGVLQTRLSKYITDKYIQEQNTLM
jgi:hypothetical protein